MRIGMLARAERRGLGTLTREFARHMKPDKTLVIRPRAAIEAGLEWFPEWYNDAGRSSIIWDGFDLDELKIRAWLEGLDVVYFAESAYDWRLTDWARDAGARTVCHLMAEYDKHSPNQFNRFPPDLPRPDVFWAPTSWRLDYLPAGTEVVPVPVALDRFPPRTEYEGPPRWLHVIGARAAADRNGTKVMLEALRYLRGEHRVIIRSQGDQLYPNGRIGRHVHLETHTAELPDYWQLYADADALVLPRRYGGLSLPAQEAMGAGLALVMPDVEPQASTWPIVPIVASFDNVITTSAGSIPICAPDPKDLAKTMDWLSQHRGALRVEQQRSRAWAEANSWERLEPTIRAVLERATEPR